MTPIFDVHVQLDLQQLDIDRPRLRSVAVAQLRGPHILIHVVTVTLTVSFNMRSCFPLWSAISGVPDSNYAGRKGDTDCSTVTVAFIIHAYFQAVALGAVFMSNSGRCICSAVLASRSNKRGSTPTLASFAHDPQT
jgi:hypothetical protein